MHSAGWHPSFLSRTDTICGNNENTPVNVDNMLEILNTGCVVAVITPPGRVQDSV